MQNNTIEIPAPRESVAQWPVVGDKVYAVWWQAYPGLPGLVESRPPKIRDIAKAALGFGASIGSGLLQFVAAFIIAGIVMAFGEANAEAGHAE